MKTKRNINFSDFPSAIVIFVVAVIYFAFTAPRFLSMVNIYNLLTQSVIPCLLVVGVAMVIISGGMDLSVGGMLSLSGCLSGIALREGLPLAVAILIGVGVGILCGLCNGLMISKMKIPPFIATLAMLNIAFGLSNTFSKKKPVYWEPNAILNTIGNGGVMGFPVFVIIGMLVITVIILVFYATRLQTYTYVLGGNEEVLHLSGGNVTKWKLMIYSVSGMLAGIAGIMMNARVSCADPTAGTGLEFTAVVGAVIGGNVQKTGKGTLFGALLGAFTLSTMRNGLSLLKMQTHWQMVVTGIVLVVGIQIHELTVSIDNQRKVKKVRDVA